jgi:hypothetical protein
MEINFWKLLTFYIKTKINFWRHLILKSFSFDIISSAFPSQQIQLKLVCDEMTTTNINHLFVCV